MPSRSPASPSPSRASTYTLGSGASTTLTTTVASGQRFAIFKVNGPSGYTGQVGLRASANLRSAYSGARFADAVVEFAAQSVRVGTLQVAGRIRAVPIAGAHVFDVYYQAPGGVTMPGLVTLSPGAAMAGFIVSIPSNVQPGIVSVQAGGSSGSFEIVP